MEEAVKHYSVRRRKGSQTYIIDNIVEFKDWPQPADAFTIKEVTDHKESSVQAYTDGSKQDQADGSGPAIFIGEEIVTQIKIKVNSRCSNNQDEHLAVIKALETI
jgi:hypothetical protein